MDFAVLTDHRLKIKESEKRDKYLDLAREQRKMWKMTMTVKPTIVTAAPGMPPTGDWKCWKSEEESRSSERQDSRDQPEFLDESRTPEKTCCHSDSIERLSANTGVKELAKRIIIIIIIIRPDLIIINKRKRICKIVDFAVPSDHRINLKES